MVLRRWLGLNHDRRQCRDMQNCICPVTRSAAELGLGLADGAGSRTETLTNI